MSSSERSERGGRPSGRGAAGDGRRGGAGRGARRGHGHGGRGRSRSRRVRRRSPHRARELGATVVERPAPERLARARRGRGPDGPEPGRAARASGVRRGASAAGVPVRGDIDLGMEAARVPVVAVTGTNGKSTVTTLITAILNASGVRAAAAGNIGRPLLDVVEEPVDVIVVEVSSFQLHTHDRGVPAPGRGAAERGRRPSRLARLVRRVHRGQGARLRAPARRRPARREPRRPDRPRARGATAPARSRRRSTATPTTPGAYIARRPDSSSRRPASEIIEIAALRHRLPHDLTNALAATAAATAVGGTRGRGARDPAEIREAPPPSGAGR